jgi:hypothetical protein
MSEKNYLVDIPQLKQKYGEEIIGTQKTKNGKVEIVHGILSVSDIHPGQKWIGSGGSIVSVCKVEECLMGTNKYERTDYMVTYTWMKGETQVYHEKLAFAFQCRYCLVVPKLNK